MTRQVGVWLAALGMVALVVGAVAGWPRVVAADDGGSQRSGVRAVRPEEDRGRGQRQPVVRAAGEPVEVLGPNRNASEGIDHQNEPSITVRPDDPMKVVAAANDYRDEDSEMWAYYSGDGGDSWAQVGIDDPVAGRNFLVSKGQIAVRGDPVLAWGSGGTVYASFISFNRDDDTQGGLWVARSTDNGQTWPVVAEVDRNDAEHFSDKEYIAVDATGGTHDGNVYVTWTNFSEEKENQGRPIMLSRSTDGGLTYATTRISACASSQGSVPVVGPKGHLYIVWKESGSGACGSRIRGARSADGGATFGPEFTVATVNPISNPLPHTNFRTNSFPSIAVDQESGDLYVTFADDSSGDADVYVVKSTTGGQSWGDRVRVDDDATGRAQFFPWVAVAPNGNVGVLFLDRRDDPAEVKFNAYLAVSEDGGQSFLSNARVSAVSSDPSVGFDGGFIGDYIGLAASSVGFHASWIDTRVGDQEIFVAKLPLDASGKPPVDPKPTPLGAPSGLVAVAEGTGIRLTWQDNATAEAGFRLQRRREKRKDWHRRKNLAANTESHLDEGKKGRVYCYQVLALGSERELSEPSNVDCAARLTAPALVSPADGAVVSGRPDLVWKGVPHAETYRVEIGSDEQFSSLAQSFGAAAPKDFPRRPLTPGTYYWRVIPKTFDGGTGPTSEARRLVVE